MALALLGAAGVPLRVAQCAAEVGALVQALRARTSPRMGSDLTVAMALARAAMEGALANVEINLDSLQEEDAAEGRAAFIAETRATVAELRNRLQAMA
jgi:formiminotetrahydrofolate cyclodeaminase